jgi:intraflagellar transport protein 88
MTSNHHLISPSINHQSTQYSHYLLQYRYKAIVKNRDYPQAGRLRVNIGNIMFDQKKYPQAIKEYRMALDQIPATSKDLRFKIFRNIGNSFVKLGQFQDAIESFETVMGGAPDIQTAFNLLLCLYARGDKDKIRRHFTKMLTLPVPGMTEDDIEKLAEIPDATLDRVDTLREELQQRHETSNDRVLSSARLIAPIIEESTYYSVMLLFFLLVLFVMSLSVCLSVSLINLLLPAYIL